MRNLKILWVTAFAVIIASCGNNEVNTLLNKYEEKIDKYEEYYTLMEEDEDNNLYDKWEDEYLKLEDILFDIEDDLDDLKEEGLFSKKQIKKFDELNKIAYDEKHN